MALGKQAKTLSKAQFEGALGYVGATRYPLRNRVILLLSVKAGFRAKEVASLTWAIMYLTYCAVHGKLLTIGAKP